MTLTQVDKHNGKLISCSNNHHQHGEPMYLEILYIFLGTFQHSNFNCSVVARKLLSPDSRLRVSVQVSVHLPLLLQLTTTGK